VNACSAPNTCESTELSDNFWGIWGRIGEKVRIGIGNVIEWLFLGTQRVCYRGTGLLAS